jgi:hypothetical protein
MHSSGKSERLTQVLSENVSAAGGIFLEVFMAAQEHSVGVEKLLS